STNEERYLGPIRALFSEAVKSRARAKRVRDAPEEKRAGVHEAGSATHRPEDCQRNLGDPEREVSGAGVTTQAPGKGPSRDPSHETPPGQVRASPQRGVCVCPKYFPKKGGATSWQKFTPDLCRINSSP